jgi:hypothetical protein
MDKRLKTAAEQAANDLDQVLQGQAQAQDQARGQYGQDAAGVDAEAFGHSTPGPSSGARRNVVFATTPVTPIVRVGEDDEDLDDLDLGEEPELSLQEQAAAAVVAVYAGGAASAASKRDAQPQPLSFWQGKTPDPVAMGQIGGRPASFIGKRPRICS